MSRSVRTHPRYGKSSSGRQRRAVRVVDLAQKGTRPWQGSQATEWGGVSRREVSRKRGRGWVLYIGFTQVRPLLDYPFLGSFQEGSRGI